MTLVSRFMTIIIKHGLLDNIIEEEIRKIKSFYSKTLNYFIMKLTSSFTVEHRSAGNQSIGGYGDFALEMTAPGASTTCAASSCCSCCCAASSNI